MTNTQGHFIGQIMEREKREDGLVEVTIQNKDLVAITITGPQQAMGLLNLLRPVGSYIRIGYETND